MQVVEYSQDALADVADHVLAMAAAENLPAHGEAVVARFPDRFAEHAAERLTEGSHR